MSIVTQISKDGTNHEIGAIYDDLNQKISETYVTKEALDALSARVKALEDAKEAEASSELDA